VAHAEQTRRADSVVRALRVGVQRLQCGQSHSRYGERRSRWREQFRAVRQSAGRAGTGTKQWRSAQLARVSDGRRRLRRRGDVGNTGADRGFGRVHGGQAPLRGRRAGALFGRRLGAGRSLRRAALVLSGELGVVRELSARRQALHRHARGGLRRRRGLAGSRHGVQRVCAR